MQQTLYRRPLPEHAIPFASTEGRRVFAEALAAGGLEGYFTLAEQFHTQADPAFCGLGSLVVALNAMGVDPGRLWKGPWRWFAEDMLDCCVPLATVRERGLDLDELGCLARCNGAEVEVRHADPASAQSWRAVAGRAARGELVLIAAYDRAALGQSGSGHFSPIGGYHAARDLVLVLDVARFKYPPHWLAAERLHTAMLPPDPTNGRARGWLALKPRPGGIALGFSIRCKGESWRTLGERLHAIVGELAAARDLESLARAVRPLCDELELRTPTTSAHERALATTRAALRAAPAYPRILAAVGPEAAESTTLLLLTVSDRLTPPLCAELELPRAQDDDADLGRELANLRAQLVALART